MSKLWIELMSQAELETRSLTYKIEKTEIEGCIDDPLVVYSSMIWPWLNLQLRLKKKKEKLQKLRWIQRNVHVAIFYLILW